MPISNVRSAEYRAAGGRAWNKVKSGKRTVQFDGPDTPHKLANQLDWHEKQDTAQSQKDSYRQGKVDGFNGRDNSDHYSDLLREHYLAGLSYGNYCKDKGINHV